MRVLWTQQYLKPQTSPFVYESSFRCLSDELASISAGAFYNDFRRAATLEVYVRHQDRHRATCHRSVCRSFLLPLCPHLQLVLQPSEHHPSPLHLTLLCSLMTRAVWPLCFHCGGEISDILKNGQSAAAANTVDTGTVIRQNPLLRILWTSNSQ